jgi:hypothetical protein
LETYKTLYQQPMVFYCGKPKLIVHWKSCPHYGLEKQW